MSGSAQAQRAAWSAGVLVLGSMSLALAWGHWLPMLVLAASAVAPLAMTRAALAAGVSRLAVAVVLALLLVLAAYVLGSVAGTPLRDTVVDAVPRLLSSPQPYAVRADLLAAPLLLTGLVSLIVGLRLDGAALVAPVAGAGGLYAAGALLTGGTSDRYGLLAVGIALSGLAGWLCFDPHPEPIASRITVAAPLGVAAVGLLAAAATLPVSNAFDPRELVQPPVRDFQAASPLPQLRAWAEHPDAELLRVSGDEVPLRLATLDVYDGKHWQTDGRFGAFGAARPDLPAPDQVALVEGAITLEGLGGFWLPSPGDPSGTDHDAALVDARTGNLLSPDAVTGARYEVSARIPRPTAEQLVAATVPTGPDVARYLELPPLPPGLTAYAAQLGGAGTRSTYEHALVIEAAVRQGRTLSARTPSGSALWRIERFLLGPVERPGGLAGTSEQFATAFAVLARANDLPTRVVVGFRPGRAVGTSAERTVRGRDAFAWPEVYFEDLGWVPFSPSPEDDTFTQDRPAIEVSDEGSVEVREKPGDVRERDRSGSGGRDGESESAPSVPLWWAATALPMLGVGGLLLTRTARSWRHRRRGPVGAWAEVVDGLVLAGLRPSAHSNATQVGAYADAALGLDAAGRLSAAAQRVAFAPAPGPASADQADDVRRDLVAVRRAARRRLPVWRRLLWWVDPRIWRR